ncbi:hypothetical protein GQ53DRAFT_777745 [Thozetella sp. PMI_491]|nr:hypothetical protein GQ53DRAFT_777745 [Thozetella sp. PMI_491]
MAISCKSFALLALLALRAVVAQEDGYIGYTLEQRGDPESVVYETADTDPGVNLLVPEPDVYLNASVHVGEIDIEVDNITAKVNLDAQVLKLLHFSAGVDASIDRVKLTIQNVTAKVELEARLENVVAMVNDVLHSIDLNPIVATLGQDVGKIVNNTVGIISGNGSSGSSVTKRDLEYNLKHNILYSVNNYQGDTHTNRMLAQDGAIYDLYLDNDGNESGRNVVGWYASDMSFNGHNRTISIDGVAVEYEVQYVYTPFPGVDIVSNVYVTPAGKVTRTKVIAEAQGGGTSTISDDSDA